MGSNMQVAVKIFFFAFWVSSFILAENQVITCLLGSPTTGVVSTKPIGKNIFLAGEYVEIICSKKYWIFGTKQVSRNIKCQEDGKWEFRPVCEDTTCEYPKGEHLLNNPPNFKRIYKSGENTWYRCEYGYQCTAESITCTENGWEPEPRCIEITCQKPEIAHGEVMGIQKNTYNRNVKIALKCNQGYEPGIFFVTCNQNGEWDNMRQCTLGINLRCRDPEREINDAIRNDPNLKAYYEEGGSVQYKCKEGFHFQNGSKAMCSAGKWKYPQCIKLITCLLGSPTTGVVSTKPIGKNIFLAGEYVEIICSKKYWIFGTKQVSRNIKCQEDGKWEFRPVCEDTTCEYPKGEHLLNNPPNFKWIYKLGENTWYRCEYGYQRTAESITCTENGWEPEPRCSEITCQKPEIAHGEVMGIQKNTYNRNVKIVLKCNQGYEPGIFFVTCNQNGEWDNMRQCTLGINLRCRDPEREINDAIRNDPNLKAYYEEGGGVQYKCREDFYFQNGSKAMCSAGKWKYPQCIKSLNTDREGKNETVQSEESFLHENVTAGQTRLQSKEVTCTEGELQNVKIVYGFPGVSPPFKPRHSLNFQCTNPGWTMTGQSSITCREDGTWSSPYPTCSGCGPPPHIEFADLTTLQKSYYINGERVEYRCQQYYTIWSLYGQPFKTCAQGTWNGSVKCLKPCIVTIEDMDANNIRQYYGQKRKMYSQHGDHLSFTCQSGKRPMNKVAFRQQCRDGEMHLPLCM
ncbi:complement factor H isoform X2 [Ictalurus furcatus]|uniref:complement factor H isoform X2 n=1 Tax=Ictalurus furcatus TaxID=66913 RepID=UPI0023510151|nr:complement factor H isoform X2 [Ictalurus furcatus]